MLSTLATREVLVEESIGLHVRGDRSRKATGTSKFGTWVLSNTLAIFVGLCFKTKNCRPSTADASK